MSASAYSLLGFVAWTMLLTVIVGSIRVTLVLTKQRLPNEFPADEDHGGSAFYRRLLRAHLNCVENLPLYAVVILLAQALGVTGLTDSLAYPFLGCRIAQSLVHLIGTTPHLVNVRFTLFVAQYAILATMITRLVF